ncbi:neuroblastoma breakpoint family member 15-like [Pan troglodytes]|uniref:neuroblastoma breakpoint family member 15-like n=1 Tax=Pan troglodytes TaxID=9598 RepID=UPI0023F36B1E|nr:neuroblastoma breakpoint family member 15-like [Pan troglodytes]XP_054519112.1 neuroblastoma breakpoint family member 15-like [Pan troglodytes]
MRQRRGCCFATCCFVTKEFPCPGSGFRTADRKLSRELLEVVEPEVLQDSLDRCYSTPSSCLEQPDSCQPYGSSFYALEEKHVGFSLDVGEIEKKGKGKKRRGRRSKPTMPQAQRCADGSGRA